MTKLRITVLGVLVVTGIATLLVSRDHLRTGWARRTRHYCDRRIGSPSWSQKTSGFQTLWSMRLTLSRPSSTSSELLRLRGEVGVLRQQTNELGALRNNNVTLAQALAEAETNQLPAEDQLIVRQTHAVDATTTLLQAIKKYAMNHNGQYPVSLDQLMASGGLGATNLAGNLRFNDFEFSPGAGGGPQGNQAMLKLRVPIAKPGGGAVMVVGGIDDAGVPHTSVWNVSP